VAEPHRPDDGDYEQPAANSQQEQPTTKCFASHISLSSFGPFLGEINLQLARHLALASIYIVYITYTPCACEEERGRVFGRPQLLAALHFKALLEKCGLISSRPSPAAMLTFFPSTLCRVLLLFLAFLRFWCCWRSFGGWLFVNWFSHLSLDLPVKRTRPVESMAAPPPRHATAAAIKVAPQPDGWLKATTLQENTEEGRKEAGS